MRKLLLQIVLIQTIFLVGCSQGKTDKIEIKNGDIITMENVDDYMFRDDVQYVDLRNFDSRFLDGFIYSFESIPFYDYLDYRAFDRNDTYVFEPSHIISERQIERFFDKDKTIFLYADGCVRSGYILDLLTYLGYDSVFTLGGFFNYEGEHKVLGDGRYQFGDSFYDKYYDSVNDLTYYIYGSFTQSKKIIDIRFDIVDSNLISLRTENYDDSINYNSLLTDLENYIVYDLVTFPELLSTLEESSPSGYESYTSLDSTNSSNIINLISMFIPD